MPIISQFYGIIIRMYFDENNQHHLPHFHAQYGDYEASFTFEGELIIGDFPKKQTKLVSAWAEIHIEELTALWTLTQTEGEYFKIEGLR